MSPSDFAFSSWEFDVYETYVEDLNRYEKVRCFAFPARDSRGTWDCIRKAVAAGIETTIRRVAR